MPRSAELKMARQGGVDHYRSIKRDGHTYTCAITKKKGPQGGRTVCWERKKD